MKHIRISIPALKVRSNSMRLTALAAFSLFVYLLFPATGSMQKQADFSDNLLGGAFVSGTVTADGAPLPGATVVLSGAQSLSTTTDAGGNYLFNTTSATGNYTVTVSKNTFVFTPANQSVALSGTGQSNVSFGGASLCAPASSGLLAWYRAEGNAVDSSGFGSNGQMQSSASNAAGKVGQSFVFDGSSGYVDAFDSPALSVTNQITLQAWINPNNTTAAQQQIVSKYDPVGNRRSYAFYIFGAKLGLTLSSNGVNGPGVETVNDVITAGVFTHVAVTFDGATKISRFYVNGAEVPGTTNPAQVSNIFDSSAQLRIGTIQSSGGALAQFFGGKIDEAQIYNRALSATEIAANFASESAGVCTSGAVFTNANPNGKIAFSSSRTFNNEIFTINADGSNPVNLTNNIAGDDQPSWSPDGSKIAFVRQTGNFDIYTMNADGSSQIRLTTDTGNDETPGWSPNGTKILFSSNRTGGGDIYVMDADGSNQTRLTTDINSDYAAKFSPDGTKIVFESNRDGNYELYMMNPDGTNQTRLTNSAGFDGIPVFSPDGSKIAFYSVRTGNFNIFVMNADGSGQVNISNNPADDWLPRWSSDGTKIVFSSSRDTSSGEIYTMNADGSSPVRLTNSPGSDYYPAWQISNGTVRITPASNVGLTFTNAVQSGNTIATPLAANQLPVMPNGYTQAAETTAYDIRTSAGYTGNITVSFNVPHIADALTCTRLRVVHFENGAWSPATNNATPQYNSGTQVCAVAQTVMSLSPFAVIALPGPTAANLSVGGRVLNAGGGGIKDVTISLTDMQGNTRTALSSPFGYYRFDDIPAGETVIVTALAKRYTFIQPQQVLQVQTDTNDVNFVADNYVFSREQ